MQIFGSYINRQIGDGQADVRLVCGEIRDGQADMAIDWQKIRDGKAYVTYLCNR